MAQPFWNPFYMPTADESGALNQYGQPRQLPDGRWQFSQDPSGQGYPSTYDPQYGYVVPDDQYQQTNSNINSLGSGGGWLSNFADNGGFVKLLMSAAGGLALGGAGVAPEAAASGAAGSTLPASYWSTLAENGAAGVPSAATGTVAGTTGAAPGFFDSIGNWISNQFTPSSLATTAASTGLSQLAKGSGDSVDTGAVDYGRGADFNQLTQDYGVNSGGLVNGGGGSFLDGLTPSNYLSLAQIASGGLGALAAKSAANTQANASTNAALLQQQQFNTINAQQQPWIQSGVGALNSINSQLPYFNHQFDANDLKTNLAPNYQFQLDQGLGAVTNASNLQNGTLSGNTLKGINDYAQNFAGGAYQQAFNNYSQNQSNIYNRLSNLAGLGGQAAQTNATAGTALAGNAGSALSNAGAAQAAGTVGLANNLSSGLTNAASWYALPSILQQARGS